MTVTSTLPPFLWIAIAPAAVARFQYPAECMAHKCPGHPHKGPLYYSLDTVGTMPAELHQALRTHPREHHGDMAVLAPHGRATSPPRVLAPETRPGVWSHDLPAWRSSEAVSWWWMQGPRRRVWPWPGSSRAGLGSIRPRWP